MAASLALRPSLSSRGRGLSIADSVIQRAQTVFVLPAPGRSTLVGQPNAGAVPDEEAVGLCWALVSSWEGRGLTVMVWLGCGERAGVISEGD